MRLNYLYHRRRVSLLMAENAASEASRSIHLELADRYSHRIAAAKRPQASADAA